MKIFLPEIITTEIVALILCLFSWTGQFSYEFSFFLSCSIYFIATVSFLFRFKKSNQITFIWKIASSYLSLLILPLLTVLLFSLKYGMCSFSSGLEWFFILPVVTLIYAVSCAIWALSYEKNKCTTLLLTLTPTLFFSLITLIDLYIDPSLSFYHPVLGYFPGPVYDDWIPKFSSLYSYRGWVVLMSIWLASKNFLPKKIWKCFVVLLFAFFFRGSLGWHSSHEELQQHLSHHLEGEHVNVFYTSQDDQSMGRMVKSLDFYAKTICEKLNVSLPKEKFRIYIYPKADDKKKWSGTADTLIGNPMQHTLQLLSMEATNTVLVHELTHIIAAPMGMPILKISPNIGLLEGLATSFQPMTSKLSNHEWAKIMMDLHKLPDISQVLSPISFWKENPTKVYLATGSFCQWLLENFDVENFKKVYHGVSFEKAYGKPLNELVDQWKDFLKTIPTPEGYTDIVDFYISQKSFYQKNCAHEVANLEVSFDQCKEHCEKYLEHACSLDSANPELQLQRARYHFQKNIHSTIDTSMLPLPSPTNSSSQNNRIQLLEDDFQHVQDSNYDYSENTYNKPTFEMTNAVLTRIYLSKHSKDVLDGILLGNYVPDPNLTWPSDEYSDQALYYFAKLSQYAAQPQNAWIFLSKINPARNDFEFQLAYWLMFAQISEDTNRFQEGLSAYQTIEKIGNTQGLKDFSALQIKRLNYLLKN